MRILLLATISFLLIGCHGDVEELTHLHGKSEAAVIAELGAPSSSNVMPLKHGVTLPELYMEIHNTYDPSDPKVEGVKIKELRWDRSGYTEAVFMHKINGTWTVLESCRWKDGVAF
jgi:hypothetical protein